MLPYNDLISLVPVSGKSFINRLLFQAFMAINQDRSQRKPSGGKYKRTRSKKLHRMGRSPSHTKIEERKLLQVATKGGNLKHKLMSADIVNLYDPQTKKHSKEKVTTASENPANRHYSRRNIITKGAIVQTAKGKARITSRPGQEGTLNAVLVEQKK